ncbi:unnamed protein product [Closterium sp. NIES-54]
MSESQSLDHWDKRAYHYTMWSLIKDSSYKSCSMSTEEANVEAGNIRALEEDLVARHSRGELSDIEYELMQEGLRARRHRDHPSPRVENVEQAAGGTSAWDMAVDGGNSDDEELDGLMSRGVRSPGGLWAHSDPLHKQALYPSGLVTGILTWCQSGLGFESRRVHLGGYGRTLTRYLKSPFIPMQTTSPSPPTTAQQQQPKHGGGVSEGGEKWKRAKDGQSKGGKGGFKGNCYVCGRPGHIAKYCRQRADKEADKGGEGSGGSSASGKGGDGSKGSGQSSCAMVKPVIEHPPPVMLEPEARGGLQAIAVAVKANPSVVLLDSGCSHHLMGDRSAFVEMSSGGGIKHVIGFNGAPQEASLLSAGQLRDSGVQLLDAGDVTLLRAPDGSLLGRAEFKGRVLCTNFQPCSTQQQEGETVALRTLATGVRSKVDTWHARLAHVGVDTIERTAAHGSVTGLELEKGGKSGMPCVSCVGGKITRHTFLSVGEEEDELLGVVHADLCGPFHEAAKDDSRYLLVLKDRKTCAGGKLAPKARWGLHLGVSAVSKGWQVLDLESNCLITTVEAVFYETISLAGWKAWHQQKHVGRPLYPRVVPPTAPPPSSPPLATPPPPVIPSPLPPSILPAPAPPSSSSSTAPPIGEGGTVVSTSVMITDGQRLVTKQLQNENTMDGVQQSGGQETGEQQTGEQQTGEQPIGEQQIGEEQIGEEQIGEQQTGEQEMWGIRDGGRVLDSRMITAPLLRRSTRITRGVPPVKYAWAVVIEPAGLDDEEWTELDPDVVADPERQWDIAKMTVKEALGCWKGDKVKEAMDEEMRSLIEQGTWELVPRPPGMNVMKNRWILNTKFRPNGIVEHEKGRLVVKGFTQVAEVDYEETYAPVGSYVLARVLLEIATALDLDLMQLDVKNAFLHGVLDRDLYMEQPSYYEDGSPVGATLRFAFGLLSVFVHACVHGMV